MGLKIKMIVALSANNCIGKNGDLVLTHRDDFKRFKKLTEGHTIVMGRKTWDSLPENNRPLPNRRNVVISTTPNPNIDGVYWVNNIKSVIDDGKLYNELYKNYDIGLKYLMDKNDFSEESIRECIEEVEEKSEEKILWIIGGGNIYKQFIDMGIVDEIHITRWKQEVDGDTFFPELDAEKWHCKYIMNNIGTDFRFETWLPK